MKLLEVQHGALGASDGKAGFGYFMEMGLGKTATALHDFLRSAERRDATRGVVVAPNSFKGGWGAEISKWGLGIDPFVWQSGYEGYLRSWIRASWNKPPLIIINYEAIRSQKVRDLLYEYMRPRPSFLIFDESIQLKQYDSAQTKAALEMVNEATVTRILSGKPMTQGPHDLWAQMRAIKQQDGRSYFAWKTLFCKMGGFKGKEVMGAQNEDYMGKLVNPHVFWAAKSDWTDLPPKMYTSRTYELTPEMREPYESMERDFLVWLSEQEVVAIDAMITKYIKLAQIQTGWIYDDDGKPRSLVPDERNPRLRLLHDIVNNQITGKAVVVYHHKQVLAQLTTALAPLQPAQIAGGASPDVTEAEKRRFNDDPNCRVILIQAQAGKYGHTLLGGPEPQNHCSTSIFYENTYSLDGRSQLEDRNHRYGQLGDSVLYIDLVATSLDERVTAALQRKEDMYKAAMSGIIRRVPGAYSSGGAA